MSAKHTESLLNDGICPVMRNKLAREDESPIEHRSISYQDVTNIKAAILESLARRDDVHFDLKAAIEPYVELFAWLDGLRATALTSPAKRGQSNDQ